MPPDVRLGEGHGNGEESQVQTEELEAQQEAAIITELTQELYYSCLKFLSHTIMLLFIIWIQINEVMTEEFLRIYFVEVACVCSLAFYVPPLLLAMKLIEKLPIIVALS